MCGIAISQPIFEKTKNRRSLSSQRELVKRLQLQTLLKHLEGKDSDLNFAAALDEYFHKREAESEVQFPERVKSEITSEISEAIAQRETKTAKEKRDDALQSNINWDIVNRNVPFGAPRNENSLSKRGAPCRKRRSVDNDVEKRHLKTPPGEGLVPQYNLYDEICEDSQPVEVVKIKKLIVEDGIIKDNDIIEPSMLH